LPECDPATEWRRFSFLQPAKMNFVAGKIDNLGSDLASPTVKENRAISALHPQNIAGMVGLPVPQTQRIWIPISRRDVKAVHSAAIQPRRVITRYESYS